MLRLHSSSKRLLPHYSIVSLWFLSTTVEFLYGNIFSYQLPTRTTESSSSDDDSSNTDAKSWMFADTDDDCDLTIDWEVKTYPGNTKPYLPADSDVFTTTYAYCNNHLDYKSCTNEHQEDCQWVFLSGSSPSVGGYCRVDPVSKCLETKKCVCNTKDFHGGDSNLGNGILFHVPISITARDVGPYANTVEFKETYGTTVSTDEDPNHPIDEHFFISKVDFTRRKIDYNIIDLTSPLLSASAGEMSATITFKLHFLYMDTNMVGTVWDGMGLKIKINTAGAGTLTVNGLDYNVPQPMKKWHCTQIAITLNHIYIAGQKIVRDSNGEDSPNYSNPQLLTTVGPFSGELFDVRVYKGILSKSEIGLVGARCTNPDDSAVLNLHKDIETPILRGGCDPDIDPIPSNGRQTYASGPFATFWVAPRQDENDSDIFHDIPEGEFDEEHLFQQTKVQAYAWERWYFETDMIGFSQSPYRSFNSADEVPGFSKKVWNNPCRYIHQHNNGWLFPFYGGDAMPKWESDGVQTVFDLGYLYKNRGHDGYGFVVHETFHGMQGELMGTYNSPGGRFLAESTASFGADLAFPATQTYISPYQLAHALPLNYFSDRDAENNPYFQTKALSVNDAVRGGHIYAAFVFWSFLSSYAGIPHTVGQMYSMHAEVFGENHYGGELLALRMFVESRNLDLGDLFGIFVAHLRTWDYPEFSNSYIDTEQTDFDSYSSNEEEWPFDSSVTLEARKTDVVINRNSGTSGNFVQGPANRRPGQFGWNCLTISNVSAGKFVSITIKWEDLGMDDANPAELHSKQEGCDDDNRFYNSMVVAHNKSSGNRRYWKLKGKNPSKISLEVGNSNSVTVYILLIPTPPSDYVDSEVLQDSGMPSPTYSYRYKVDVLDSVPASGVDSPVAKENGIVVFSKATSGWWPIRCTCTVLGNNLSVCPEPNFGIQPPPVCANDRTYKYQNKKKQNCKWVAAKPDRRKNLCKKFTKIRTACPMSCGICCKDDKTYRFKANNGKRQTCKWIKKKSGRVKKYCVKANTKSNCPVTCTYCQDPV